MLYRTNVGDYRVTVWNRGTHPLATYCFDVSQRHHDHVAEMMGEDPHRQVGFGLCATAEKALDAALGHASDVVNAADLVQRSLNLDVRHGRNMASSRTMRLLLDYDRLVNLNPPF